MHPRSSRIRRAMRPCTLGRIASGEHDAPADHDVPDVVPPAVGRLDAAEPLPSRAAQSGLLRPVSRRIPRPAHSQSALLERRLVVLEQRLSVDALVQLLGRRVLGGWAFAAIASAIVYGAIVDANSQYYYPSYQVQPSSPGAQLLQSYELQQTPCGPAGLVVIWGPNNSVICAYPNAIVSAGITNSIPRR